MREPMAIVGMGCRFPGGVTDPASLWKLICEGVDAVGEIPPDRWNADRFYDPEGSKPGKSVSRWGGFITDVDKFDPAVFGISPREAAFIDPQQRLLLEAAWEALEDGGLAGESAERSDTGVFIGISTQDYARLQSSYADLSGLDLHSPTGSTASIAANRISYCLNLSGPSFVVDTACSSSLVALHLACQSLRNGECKTALVGGVNVILTPDTYVGFTRMGMLSPDGRCKAFDASGNGFVRGEGVGMILLKPLSDAIINGDPIYAVVLGTAVNQDGHTNGMTVPNPEAQMEVVRAACRNAGIDPSEIQYVEAHGTGTPVGDPMEAHALGHAIGKERPADAPLVIGSLKTNIGHLEAGAGIAGIIKLALALKHGMLPASLHFKVPNPNIPFDELNLRVQDTLGPWPASTDKRLGGINSFGFGGTNAHAVLSSAPVPQSLLAIQSITEPFRVSTTEPAPQAELLLISAVTPEALRSQAERYRDFIKGRAVEQGLRFVDICHTAATRRRHHYHRVAVVASSLEEASEHLTTAMDEPGISRSAQPQPVFVFTGQGPQWWGMGRELLAHEPVFRTKIEECDSIIQSLGGWSLLDEMSSDESSSRMHETRIAQPAICALQIALAALWESWGIKPAAVVGHSVGEIAGAHIAGVLSLRDAMAVIYHRGRCMEGAAEGKMLAAGMPPHEAQVLVAKIPGVVIAAWNSPFSVTLSGECSPVEELSRTLESQGVFQRLLNVPHGFHSHLMDFVREDLIGSLGDIEPRPPVIPLISTVSGKSSNGAALDADYWWSNVRQPVRFSQAIDSLIRAGHTVFLELGPHPALATSIKECLRFRGKAGVVLSSLRKISGERQAMLESLGTLHCMGHAVAWKGLYPVESCHVVRLPGYAWQRERFWNEAAECQQARLALPEHPLLGRRLGTCEPAWEVKFDLRVLRYLGDHRVQGRLVFPGAGYVEMALTAAFEALGGDTDMMLEDIEFIQALFLTKGDEIPTVLTTFRPDDSVFNIAARSAHSSWTSHCRGRARSGLDNGERAKQQADWAELKATMTQLDSKEGYSYFDAIGLQYGPSFLGIESLWRRPGESLAHVRVPDAVLDAGEEYRLHPALLDACFQAILATVPDIEGTMLRLYLPFQLDRFQFFKNSGKEAWCHAKLVKHTSSVIEGSFVIRDGEGFLVAEVTGFRCRATAWRAEGPEREWLYGLQWELKPLAGREFLCRPGDYLPDLADLVQQRDLVAGQSEAKLDDLFAHQIVHAFRQLGWSAQLGDLHTLDSAAGRMGVVEERLGVLDGLLHCLAGAGLVEDCGEGWVVISDAPKGDPLLPWRETVASHPTRVPELMLLERCARALPDVLRGQRDPAEALIGEGGLALVEHLLADSPTCLPMNALARDVICSLLEKIPEGRRVRVLELGTGTGGRTGHILPELQSSQVEYWITDPAERYVQAAADKWRDRPSTVVQIYDTAKSPAEQGLPLHGFDVVISPGLLCSAADSSAMLREAALLLAPRGVLVILSQKTPQRWLDVMLGWIRQEPSHRYDSGLAEKLALAGFSAPVHMGTGAAKDCVTLVARAAAPDAIDEATIKVSSPVEQPLPGTWLILADEDGTGDNLAKHLRHAGRRTVMVRHGGTFEHSDADNFQVRATEMEDLHRVLEATGTGTSLLGVIHLWGLDTPVDFTTAQLRQAHQVGVHAVLHLVQGLISASSDPSRSAMPQLWLVTRGAQSVRDDGAPVAVGQSPLWGMGRVILAEHAALKCRMVDLDPANPSNAGAALFDELTLGDGEEEIVHRGEARYAQRLMSAAAVRPDVPPEAQESFRLEIPRPGVLDYLTFQPRQRRAPGPGEVEIKVQAAALNFRDTMKALGIYPTEADDAQILGDECAGTIVAVGPGVIDLQPGDDVVCIAAGCFASHVTTPASFATRKPSNLSFEEAVTIPIPFLTAWYALHHLARIAPGERVLIHAASGGVGMAALQIAQQSRAIVFATAGNEEKRSFLRALGVPHVMDSRSLKFADEIMEKTSGEGVDIVLNSLAGEAIPRSLSTLRSYGRFLEIGKRDIYQNKRIGLRPFRNNLSYFAIDLARTMQDRTQMLTGLFGDLMAQFQSGKLRPLPMRGFPMSAGVNAFRCMAQARHVGKVVLSMGSQPVRVRPATSLEGVRFVENASYLVTGGLRGFGLEVAKWLVRYGARHLVLVGRSGIVTDEARQALRDFENAGTTVLVEQADVGREEDVTRVLMQVQSSCPPLRGIFHAAMVLDDGMILQQTTNRFNSVLEPKISGAWNLHTQTLGTELDYFVVFSSISATIGNPGQSSYAAANEFLDMLARHRRSLGLSALSVAWGPLADAGYLLQNTKVQEHLTRMGLAGLPVADALKMLGRLLRNDLTQMMVARVDWRQLASVFPMVATSARFAHVAGASALCPEDSEDGAKLREAILAAPPEERMPMLISGLRDTIAKVLRTSPTKLDVLRPLTELGLDSLMAFELMNRIEADFGMTVPTGKVMLTDNITRLAEITLGLLTGQNTTGMVAAAPDTKSEEAKSTTNTASESSADILLEQLDEMTDTQVDTMLGDLAATTAEAR